MRPINGSPSNGSARGGPEIPSIASPAPSRGFDATRKATSRRPSTSSGRRGRFGKLRRLLIGTPIHSELEIHERLTKKKALAVFSSDALSSVAYAPQETLIILLAAGAAAAWWSLPISLAVVALLAIVVTSYRQTIYAYPSGGGSYIVAKDNLGELPGLTAAAALAVGYILTVSVSIASAVDQLDRGRARPGSAAGSGWASARSALITLANLRGIRESGSIFAVPTYVFLAGDVRHDRPRAVLAGHRSARRPAHRGARPSPRRSRCSCSCARSRSARRS